MARTIRIGGAGGFWGDSAAAAEQLVTSGCVDYLIFDYLAELTMSIMAKLRQRNPKAGYATDFVTDAVGPLLREIRARGIRIVTNAGGMNPRACALALQAAAAEQGLSFRIGIVEGDDLVARAPEFRAAGLREIASGAELPETLTSLNAYLGARPIVQALAGGAEIVITGRVVDSALALGPLVHEFGWSFDDLDRLAAGSLVGHVIECGTQTTGGLFTDWREVGAHDDIGYPIAECSADGTFVLTKPAGTGGLIRPEVVAEQTLYEVHDPANYLLPDVTCDLSQVTIVQDGEDRVRIAGARGAPPPSTYKASATFEDGYRSTATLTIVGREAVAKAEHIGEAILARTRAMFRRRNLGDYDETCVEVLGSETASWGETARARDAREVVLRVSVRHQEEAALNIFGREIAPFGTGGVPGTTGFSGRPKPQKLFRLFSLLVPKEIVPVTVELEGERTVAAIPSPPAAPAGTLPLPPRQDAPPSPRQDVPRWTGPTAPAPLSTVAVARSGDKGDICNIVVIARDPAHYGVLLDQVTTERVRAFLSHLVKGKVERFEAPGLKALNFVLHGALAGGGASSLRNDPLGKAFGQILLEMEIEAPAALVSRRAAA